MGSKPVKAQTARLSSRRSLGSTVKTVVGAHTGEIGGGVHITQAGDGDEMTGGRVWDERDEAATAILDEGFGGDVLAEETLELLGERGRDVGREQDGVFCPSTQGIHQGRASTPHVRAIEVEDPLVRQSDQVVRIGAVGQEDAQAISLERAGLDDGSGLGQAGMGLAELPHVDDGAGPQAVELLAQLAFQVTEEARLGADEAHLLADEKLGAGGQEGGLAQAAQHQVQHSSQVAGVGLAMA